MSSVVLLAVLLGCTLGILRLTVLVMILANLLLLLAMAATCATGVLSFPETAASSIIATIVLQMSYLFGAIGRFAIGSLFARRAIREARAPADATLPL